MRDILIARLVEKDLAEIWCPEDPMEILNDILDREHRELAEPRIIAQTAVNTLLPVYQIGLYSNQEFLGSGKKVISTLDAIFPHYSRLLTVSTTRRW